MTNDQERSIKDLEWWQSLLPEGWKIHGWSYRNSASAIGPNGRFIKLNSDLLLAFKKEKDIVEENIIACLEGAGKYAVRVCEGGGPEDINMSLAVTMVKLKNAADKKE